MSKNEKGDRQLILATLRQIEAAKDRLTSLLSEADEARRKAILDALRQVKGTETTIKKLLDPEKNR